MDAIWWILVAFFGGGFLGILVFALMQTASDMPEQKHRPVPDFDVTRW